MAIFYYDEFPLLYSSRNFGDDINPVLFEKLFSKSILLRPDLCIVGVGTLINDRNIKKLSEFRKKVIFSSGVGYGTLTQSLDTSWEVVCVRGPKTAESLGVKPEKAVGDGALLLSDFYMPVPESNRSGIVFIPHIKTHWMAAKGLKKIAFDLGWDYLPPDVPYEDFISRVSHADLVVAEAMHGAILADTMRVPWLPVSFLQHNEFKWRDWFLSVHLDYRVSKVYPQFWNPSSNKLKRCLKYPYQIAKYDLARSRLKSIVEIETPLLSDAARLAEIKCRLYECVNFINHIE